MTHETEVRKLLREIAGNVKAIRRAVDPSFGAEVPQETRKKDPRALYGDNH